MAKLEITISRAAGDKPIAHETFEISRELALELIAKMEALVAELPGRHRITRTVLPDGAACLDIELNRAPPPPARPTFETQFRR